MTLFNQNITIAKRIPISAISKSVNFAAFGMVSFVASFDWIGEVTSTSCVDEDFLALGVGEVRYLFHGYTVGGSWASGMGEVLYMTHG